VFGWFAQRRKTREENAERVLLLLEKARGECDPRVFVTPEDAAVRLQPVLTTLNIIIGKADDLRFSPIEYDSFVTQVAYYEGQGLAGKIGAAVAHEAIALALILAAMHARHNPVRRDEVEREAKVVIAFLNRVAVPYET
jgi:hypothetical protein